MTPLQRTRRGALLLILCCAPVVSCSGDRSAEPSVAQETDPARPGVVAVRTREWIEANPLSDAQQGLLDDCLEAAIGRRDLGADGGPSADDLEAYERCGEHHGLLDRIRVEEVTAPLDPSGPNRELAAEAACLADRGWRAEPEAADDRGIIFWHYPELDTDDAEQLTDWNRDRRACGVEVPDGPEDHETDGD